MVAALKDLSSYRKAIIDMLTEEDTSAMHISAARFATVSANGAPSILRNMRRPPMPLKRPRSHLPSASLQPIHHVQRHRRGDTHRRLVLRNRNDDFTRMQMLDRTFKARRLSINVVADDRPAHRGAMHAQLMRAARDRLHREPGEPSSRPITFQFVTEGNPFGSGFIHQPRSSLSRPSGISITPSSSVGPPSTTAQ